MNLYLAILRKLAAAYIWLVRKIVFVLTFGQYHIRRRPGIREKKIEAKEE
jgi:hypothetical protein